MKIKKSVREIVDFLCQSGSISDEFVGRRRMQQGQEIHQIIQEKHQKEAIERNILYEVEKKLQCLIQIDNFSYDISGRGDAIITHSHGPMEIEEIKSTAKLPTEPPPTTHAHWAQAFFYGYILSRDNHLENVLITLVYGDIHSDATVSFSQNETCENLEIYILSLMRRYHQWIIWSHNRKKERNFSIRSHDFPHDSFRKYQRDLSRAVYTAIIEKKSLFLQAPTGTGKTIGSLFPAVKAMGERKIDFIFYATAKTITRKVAFDTVLLMAASGFQLSIILLGNKETLCPFDLNCNPNQCSYALGHFDRILEALWDLLNNNSHISIEILLAQGKQHQVCPYELAKEASVWVDIVCGDYNHLFDPLATFTFLLDTKKAGDSVFLIDEAHNLVDRSKDMFSASVSKELFSMTEPASFNVDRPSPDKIKEVQKKLAATREGISLDSFYKINQKINRFFSMNALSPAIMEGKMVPLPLEKLEPFAANLSQWIEMGDSYLADANGEVPAEFLSIYFTVFRFLKVYELFIDHEEKGYIPFYDKEKELVELFALDPSHLLRIALEKSRSPVLFSATLSPMNYFLRVLGGKSADLQVIIPSPFPKEHLLVCVNDQISTYFKDRDKNYLPIVEALYSFISTKRGNYLSFFPSYFFLDQVYQLFTELHPEIETIKQEKNMDDRGKRAFLHAFHQEKPILAFGVLGGHFSEGIDLPGEKLIGCVICGVSIAPESMKQNLIKTYYDKQGGNGYAYAYQIPSMNRVLQGAGRLIRDATDRGILYLLDFRFSWSLYQSFFPQEWKPIQVIRNDELFTNFWQLGDNNTANCKYP